MLYSKTDLKIKKVALYALYELYLCHGCLYNHLKSYTKTARPGTTIYRSYKISLFRAGIEPTTHSEEVNRSTTATPTEPSLPYF